MEFAVPASEAPTAVDAEPAPILKLRNVKKSFGRSGSQQYVAAVSDVSLDVRAGETVGLIGESGSGKSTTGRIAMGLLGADSGVVEFLGKDLTLLGRRELRSLRSEFSIVFQEPEESLNPRMKVYKIVEEPLLIHGSDLTPSERRTRVERALHEVNLGPTVWDRWPRGLSGGQQQRVGIARAIVTRPRLIVLDEPTSSLDLSVRSQIMDLLRKLQRELGLAYLLISHDLRTISYLSDRIIVMYLGQIIESGPADAVVQRPRHPYTLTLLSACLSPDPARPPAPIVARGDISLDAASADRGCIFHERCPIRSDERCDSARPPLEEKEPGHAAATFCQLGEDEWIKVADVLS